jgi:hypothetical protein
MNQRVETANAQFGLIISLIFEICQLRHHADNWIELPRSIDRNIDNLFLSINLPRPDDDLRSQKIVIKNILKHDLQEAAQSHIKTQLDNALNKLKLIDPTDKDKCKEIVKRKLLHNIGRINRVNLDTWIDECINLAGSQYTRATRSYSDAVRHNIERKQNVTTNAQHTITSNAQHSNITSLDDNTLIKRTHIATKRTLPTSPTIQVSNRFDALRDLETESPMKARRLTVDEATCISGTPGRAREMRAGASAAAAAATADVVAVADVVVAAAVATTAAAAEVADADAAEGTVGGVAAVAADIAAAADAIAEARKIAAAEDEDMVYAAADGRVGTGTVDAEFALWYGDTDPKRWRWVGTRGIGRCKSQPTLQDYWTFGCY